jgi:hypothetical protein
MTLTPLILTDCRLYLDGADLTGYSNKAEMSAKAADLDRTTFASGAWKERKGGLFDGSASLEGFWQAGDLTQPDDLFWANLGVATVPLTGVPTGGNVGDLAYLTRGLETEYTPGGKVGELLSWSAGLNVNWPIVRGQILHPQGTARTATGNGTARQIGALSSTQALYVCLHVTSYTDGSLTVAVQSDDNSGMTSPTTQGTFTAATALGGQTMKINGPITDDWWRVTWTISGGVTHSFLFAASAGRGPK